MSSAIFVQAKQFFSILSKILSCEILASIQTWVYTLSDHFIRYTLLCIRPSELL